MKIIEIFKSIQGEGTRSGVPTSFIRFYGCNLNCSWCDTIYSHDEKQMLDISQEEIIEQIRSHGTTHLCLTGGEPLIVGSKLFDLIDLLLEKSSIEDIVVETNGSVNLNEVCQYRNINEKNISIIMDYKLSSSNMTLKMDIGNFSLLNDTDEIKFVVASKTDFSQAKDVMKKHYKRGLVLFSPVISLFSPAQLSDEILSYNDYPCKLSLQIHKYIWPSENRGR